MKGAGGRGAWLYGLYGPWPPWAYWAMTPATDAIVSGSEVETGQCEAMGGSSVRPSPPFATSVFASKGPARPNDRFESIAGIVDGADVVGAQLGSGSGSGVRVCIWYSSAHPRGWLAAVRLSRWRKSSVSLGLWQTSARSHRLDLAVEDALVVMTSGQVRAVALHILLLDVRRVSAASLRAHVGRTARTWRMGEQARYSTCVRSTEYILVRTYVVPV